MALAPKVFVVSAALTALLGPVAGGAVRFQAGAADAAGTAVADAVSGLTGRLRAAGDPALAAAAARLDDKVAAAVALAADAGRRSGGIDDARRVARTAAAAQERLLGAAVAPRRQQRHDTPSAAVLALAARHDVVPGAAERAMLNRLDGLDGPVRDALTSVVDAFLAFEDAVGAPRALPPALVRRVDAAVRGGDAAGLSAAALLRAAGLDAGAVVGARTAMLDAAAGLDAALRSTAGAGAATLDLCPAVAIDTGGGSQTYPTDCALIVDTAGDDTYANNAGGGSSFPCGPIGGEAPAAALIDYAGRDRYTSGRRCGVNGGAAGGAGFLLDVGGDDIYQAGPDGTNGGAAGGLGFLLDAGGDDTYYGDVHGVNGGGAIGGVGQLIDLSGDDHYAGVGDGANGGASTFGVGSLVDAGGADTYGGVGGVGFNGGARFADGSLVDVAGNDAYSAGWWAANGGSQGGSGFLFDGSGVDAYVAGGAGVNGGVTNDCDVCPVGTGLLLDAAGTGDSYTDTDPAQGGTGTDRTVWPKGTFGAQLDVASPATVPPLPPVTAPPLPTATLPAVEPPAPGYRSDDCDAAGTNVVSGFVDGGYLKLRQAPGASASATWICVAAEAGGQHLGGRVAVDAVTPGVTGPAVDQDAAAVASCATQPGNVRVQSGTVLGAQPYWIDVTPSPASSPDAAWVCVRFTGSIGFRLRVGAGAAGTPTVTFAPDPLTAHVPAYAAAAWPVAGPSAACAAAPGATRLVDVTVGSTPVALYGWSESATRAHVCVRAGAAGGAGGRLTVQPLAGQLPFSTANSTAPCPFTLIERAEPPTYGAYISDPSGLPGLPVAGCVQVAGGAVGITVTGQGTPTPVAWAPDPA